MRLPGIGMIVVLTVCSLPGLARAQGKAIHVGAWPQNITRETCAHQAMAAMAKEKFVFAEVDDQGNVWGFTDKTAVAVLSFRQVDGICAMVLAASLDNADADRLRNAIRTYIVEAPFEAEVSRRIGSADVKRAAGVPHLGWYFTQRSETKVLRFFDTAVSLLLEKRGLTTTLGGKGLVLACGPEQTLAAFALPGPNGVSVRFGALCARDDEAACDSARTITREVVKLLYK
jgi:hypothetical protein